MMTVRGREEQTDGENLPFDTNHSCIHVKPSYMVACILCVLQVIDIHEHNTTRVIETVWIQPLYYWWSLVTDFDCSNAGSRTVQAHVMTL